MLETAPVGRLLLEMAFGQEKLLPHKRARKEHQWVDESATSSNRGCGHGTEQGWGAGTSGGYPKPAGDMPNN